MNEFRGKKITELGSWTGDPSMRMTVSRPGLSQSVSISEVAGLVTTGEGLQSGDVVLRPVGAYDDAYECNGAVYQTIDSPILAGKLNFASLGTMPSSINYNSELRFGTEKYANIIKIGGVIYARSSVYSGKYHFINSGVKISEASGPPDGWFIGYSQNCFYVTNNSYIYRLYNGSAYLISNNATQGKGMIADDYTQSEDLFISIGTSSLWMRMSGKTGAWATTKSYSLAGFSSTYAYGGAKVGGQYYVSARYNNVDGIYRVSLSEGALTATEVVLGTYTSIFRGNSEYIYAKKSTGEIVRISPETSQEFIIDIPFGTNVVDMKHHKDTVFVINRGTTLPFLFSFNDGGTWEDGPIMSGYSDVWYDEISGEFAFVGGTGTSGSVNNQYGSIQTNAANFKSDSIFRVPNISSPITNFKQYITR